MKPVRLPKDAHVITAYAEPASGPGWANAPVWVIWRGQDGILQQSCLQPHEQSSEIVLLYSIAATVHGTLCRLVRRLIGG